MRMRKRRKDVSWFTIMAMLIVVADAILWYRIIFDAIFTSAAQRPGVYFLDVGKGDAALVDLGQGMRVLIDAGPGGTATLEALDSILAPADRSLALAIISYPEDGHFGGLDAVLDRYRIGAVAYNGRDASPGITAWPLLLEKIRSDGIPLLAIGTGDSIRLGDAGAIDVLSPDYDLVQGASILADTGIVALIRTPRFRALFAADISRDSEYELVYRYRASLAADILKAARHGAKDSVTTPFLRAVRPRAVIIDAGRGGLAGQPDAGVLARLTRETDADIFRIDREGTIAFLPDPAKGFAAYSVH